VTLDTTTANATVCVPASLEVACVAVPSRPRLGPFPIGVLPPLPVGGSVAVGFTIGGPIITDGLLVSATSSDTTLVPQSATVITKGIGGARVLTQGADGRSGVVTVTVTDPTSYCGTSTSLQLTIGTTAVPTLPQRAMIALTILLALAGFASMGRRLV
jgi:hypothetical protein